MHQIGNDLIDNMTFLRLVFLHPPNITDTVEPIAEDSFTDEFQEPLNTQTSSSVSSSTSSSVDSSQSTENDSICKVCYTRRVCVYSMWALYLWRMPRRNFRS